MCQMVVQAVETGDETVLQDVRRLVGGEQGQEYTPTDHRELASRILHTCYMGTTNSSETTKNFAAGLAEEVGSYHLSIVIDTCIEAITSLFSVVTGKEPKFKAHGGTNAENLALQNIQARFRMLFSYFLAQLLPWCRGNSGFLLVLSSGNVDEGLRGYMTK